MINDYELVTECKEENKLKNYVDKFLHPKHVSILSKILDWIGGLLNSLYTTKKANVISASHVSTRLPLMKYYKPKAEKQFEKVYVKRQQKKQFKKQEEEFAEKYYIDEPESKNKLLSEKSEMTHLDKNEKDFSRLPNGNNLSNGDGFRERLKNNNRVFLYKHE